MKIISELCNSQINNNKKDIFATRLSIFLAVILLGTIIFIIGNIRREEYYQVVSTVGDYHVSFSNLDSNMVKSIYNNNSIKKVAFDRLILTNFNAIIIEKGNYFKNLKGVEIVSGRNVNSTNELIAPTRFFKKYKEYNIGSKLKIKDKEYVFVGEYNDYRNSFDENILIGRLDDENKNNILENTEGLEVFIWYKSSRDTYFLTKKILDEFKVDYDKSLDIGRLGFNNSILEYKMIYPSGLIPPKNVIKNLIETYGICILLVILFAIMIYGAFNVWNNRDIKEFALLKSVGMTNNQVKSMIILKAIKISVVPILLGIIASYFTANLLAYLMWVNNFVSYKNISKIFNEKIINAEFHRVSFSLTFVFIILIFSFITVYLSAIMVYKKSLKLNIIEGLTGIIDKKMKYKKSKIKGKIENNLAKDYFKSYNFTYKIIILTMLLSSIVMTLVLVSQSYRIVNSIYGEYNSPYNFTSWIFTDKDINRLLIDELFNVDGIDELHVYEEKSFKFYLKDNKGFESNDLIKSFKRGLKNADRLYVNIIGLLDEDFNHVIFDNKLKKESNYILLNKTPDNNNSPYSFRKYINLTNDDEKNLIIRYNANGKQISIHIDDYIKDFPFELDSQNKNGIYVFTRMDNLEKLIEKYRNDEENFVNYYKIKIKTSHEKLIKVSDECNKIILSYIPKSDFLITNDILKNAADKEQLRNEYLLNFGIQIIFIILALSNAYNIFYGNLRARKREFQLFFTVGMTDKQLKKMIYEEVKILFTNVIMCYILIFIVAIFLRSYRSEYDLFFILKNILININYIPIILIFLVMALGIFIAINRSVKSIFYDDLSSNIKEV